METKRFVSGSGWEIQNKGLTMFLLLIFFLQWMDLQSIQEANVGGKLISPDIWQMAYSVIHEYIDSLDVNTSYKLFYYLFEVTSDLRSVYIDSSI